MIKQMQIYVNCVTNEGHRPCIFHYLGGVLLISKLSLLRDLLCLFAAGVVTSGVDSSSSGEGNVVSSSETVVSSSEVVVFSVSILPSSLSSKVVSDVML